MSIDGWSLVRFVHVLAAMGWVGGQLVLSGIVLPVLRTRLEPPARGPVVEATARRFAAIASIGLLPVLLATGIALAFHRGVTMGSFARPGYGQLLAIKLVLVVASVVLAAVHGILTARNPAAARSAAIGGLGTSVGIVLFATALVP